MFENYNIPQGFDRVENPDTVLTTSGSRKSVFFFEGDTITISDTVVSTVRTDSAGNKVTNDKGEPVLVYYIVASVNGNKPKEIPFGSFRRFPRDAESFLAKSPLMRQLYSGTDADRYNLLKGKTLKVTALVDGDAIDWSKTDLATRDFVYKKAKFPLFEEI